MDIYGNRLGIGLAVLGEQEHRLLGDLTCLSIPLGQGIAVGGGAAGDKLVFFPLTVLDDNILIRRFSRLQLGDESGDIS